MKLTIDRIVDAGMATFAEVGYHGLSMRRVAERLGVHAGSLYYHVRNKQDLLQFMADRVAGQALDAGTAALAGLPDDADWPARVEAQIVALRRSMLRHPGGAMLLADSPKLLSRGALGLMERLLETLRAAGMPSADRLIAADALLSHVTGFVLQEQSGVGPPEVGAEVLADLPDRFPLTMAGVGTVDREEQFLRSVRLLVGGIAALISSAGAAGDRTAANSAR